LAQTVRNMTLSPRDQLLTLFAAALEAVNGTHCVQRFLQSHPLTDKPVVLLAMGKAAAAMAAGACEVLGAQVSDGLVVTKEGHADQSLPDCLTVFESAHPVPDERSLRAGQMVIDLVQQLPLDVQLLVLTSGGASALVEALPAGMGLAELAELNRWLVGSGLSIIEMNRIRQSVSCLKGGKLAGLLRGQPAMNLLISDVPGDDPAFIASGPFYPPPDPTDLPKAMPAWVVAMQQQAASTLTSPANPQQVVPHHIVASNRHACEAALAAAQQHGWPAEYHAQLLEADAEEVAVSLVKALDELPAGIHIWGGETTLILPPQPGRGGRNQHLALIAARQIAGRNDRWLLAAGTDGTDGPTPDAGALVDGGTQQRGEMEGLSLPQCLSQANAGTFLEASGDLVHTGPTGTNVMDLVLAYKTD
jgi:glycerate 2-kinase